MKLLRKIKQMYVKFLKAFLSQKNLIEFPEIWVGDPGPRKTPRSRSRDHKAPNPRSGSATLVRYIIPDRSSIPYLRGERL